MEITTYRTETGYSDGGIPDSVEFTRSLTEDLKRRDFTVNAMAMDADGNIIDPFGGRRDLEARILKAVGDPDERFREDGLRIMRALRFSSVLGFAIEEENGGSSFQKQEEAVEAVRRADIQRVQEAGNRGNAGVVVRDI